MILRRIFSPLKVAHYLRTELTLAIIASVGVCWLYRQGISQVSLPFSIAAILGSALAIFVDLFKTKHEI